MKAKILLLSALAITALTGCNKTPDTPTQYEIAVTAPANGTITVTADGKAVEKAEAGTTVTITADANDGYDFIKWTVTGATPESETASTTTFKMPKGKVTVAAEFAEAKYNITVAAPVNGTVEVTIDGEAAEQAAAGATVTITATPADGYDFDKWTVTGATPDSETATTTTFTMPEDDVTVAAAFVETTYNITVTAPTNGTIAVTADETAVETAVEGTVITITATPDNGYDFVKWTVTGATPAVETDKTTTFTMPSGDVTVAAEFAKTKYDITVTDPTNGTITVTYEGNAIQKAVESTVIAIEATPDSGYAFVKWTITGATPAVETDKTTTFTMPSANVIVAAEFELDQSVSDPGVVMGTLKWATRNVDRPGTFAETSRSNGLFYQWNRRTAWSTTNPPISYTEDGENTSPIWDTTIVTGDSWEDANSPCPAGWRIPTEAEYNTLKNGSTSSIEPAAGDNLQATKFVDKETGNTLYFPNAGGRNSTNVNTIYSQGSFGGYWTSTKAGSANNAIYGYLYGASVMISNGVRYAAYSVRCVEKQ